MLKIGNRKEPYIGDDCTNLPSETVIACDVTKTSELHLINTIFLGLTENTTYSNYMTQHEIFSMKNEYPYYVTNKLIRYFPEKVNNL